MRRLLWALWIVAPTMASAHGEQPQVIDLTFQGDDEVWAITDNQGVFMLGPDGPRWLCEDSIEPGEGLRAAQRLDDRRWMLSTDERLYVSEDAGCTFAPAEGPLAGHRVAAFSRNPATPDEILAATDTLGRPNDLFLSEDAGRAWRPAGLALPGQITHLLRAPGDPRRIYLVHERGTLRSRDGGRSFEPFKPGPPELEATPLELSLLGSPPGQPDVLFAAIERFDTVVVRSEDAGEGWAVVHEVPDFPLSLVFHPDGRRALIHSPFAGYQRSGDSGLTWVAEAQPVERLGCVRREPGSDRLWGCTNLFFGGPWVAGTSVDFGASWRPALRTYEGVPRLACPPNTPGRDCCQHLCPGEPPGGECVGQAPQPGPACGGTDAGVADAGVSPGDVGVDAAPRDLGGVDPRPDAAPDAAPVTLDMARADAASSAEPLPEPAPPSDPGGCRAQPGAFGPFSLAPLCALLFGRRRRA